MIALLLQLVLAATTLAPVAAVAPGGTVARCDDPVRELRTWADRARRARDGITVEEEREVQALLKEVDVRQDEFAERREEIDLILLDLAAVEYLPDRRLSDEGLERNLSIGSMGTRELERRLRYDGPTFATWLADAIVRSDGQALERRIAAVHVLDGEFRPETRGALLEAAGGEPGDLRDAALQALIGWPDAAVTQFLFDSLEDDGTGINALAAHVEAAFELFSPAERDRLRAICGDLYFSADWRDAARARRLIHVLDTPRAVPVLVEALTLWDRRGQEGEGSMRIVSEIVRELRRRSARSMGPKPELWVNWWTAVQDGRIDLPEEMNADIGQMSSATFFGLEVASDKVMFVIDRSGSMRGRFGTDGRTRYEEAIDQFGRCLNQAGPDARFGTVLFSDKGDRFGTRLMDATDGNLENAVRWLEREEPQGGTQLFQGLREALRLDRRGRINVERQEVDTVVILCDGATAETAAWFEEWMARENERAQIAFHCVQIGDTGRGSLEMLAAGSGGSFVKVD